ncbi:protein downstream neighbor of Son-like isoform X1 [Mya arenaria]|uniref:protein downstream neighbor of Son-like isoform X1 n=1 Tax=Mya arenaria TaxID=6604 RepID=UPI0022E6E467|nr:protein downstream neighbor of Son-like isoform X1 [Mya arenaria]
MTEETNWKRPSEVMKIHRRRKSVSQRRIKVDADQRTSVIYKSPSKSTKRKNPFYKDSPHPFASKRIHLDNEKPLDDPLSCQLFDILDSANEDEKNTSRSDSHPGLSPRKPLETISENECFKKEIKEEKTQAEAPKPKLDETGAQPYLPVDWCLKSKLRVVSSRPLDWCVQLKSADEAQGVMDFVHDTDSKAGGEVERKRGFQQACMYWLHPNIPWMKPFPRIVEDSKASLSVSYLLQEDVQKNLHADWEQSFSSVYQQLRCGLCPYFYLCTHQFTVLFYRREGNQSGLVALLTPTTRGFRESLENEGIEFSLPVVKQQQQIPGRSSGKNKQHATSDPLTDDACEGNKEKVEDDELSDGDDAASGWLESMGLDKKQFPTLDPKKVKLQREGYRVIDNRPESLVAIEGGNIQAFFNFLLNCRTCTATSGTQAGLPPTILCPQPFKGATLKSLKTKHTAVKQSDGDGNITSAHIVEIGGPILPHHTQQLVSLIHTTQAQDFGMVFHNHDPTVPFNVLPTLVGTENEMEQSPVESGECEKVKDILEVDDMGNNDSSHVNNCDDNSLTILDSSSSNHNNHLSKSSEEKTNTSVITEKLFRNVPIADKVSAMKEVICTPNGFTWN